MAKVMFWMLIATKNSTEFRVLGWEAAVMIGVWGLGFGVWCLVLGADLERRVQIEFLLGNLGRCLDEVAGCHHGVQVNTELTGNRHPKVHVILLQFRRVARNSAHGTHMVKMEAGGRYGASLCTGVAWVTSMNITTLIKPATVICVSPNLTPSRKRT